jgi:hypothetical protein
VAISEAFTRTSERISKRIERLMWTLKISIEALASLTLAGSKDRETIPPNIRTSLASL